MLSLDNRARISWPVALTLCAISLAAVGGFIFWRIESWPARTAHQSANELERLGRDLRGAFDDVAHLQPRITINNRVYLEQTTATTELSILSRRIEVEQETQTSWLGSAKRIKLHGTFEVKAGFDLRQNVSVDLRPDQVVIQLPHAQILGVEQQHIDVLAFENGYWNRISGEDVQNELATLPQVARQKALEANLPQEAEQALQQQLQARIHVTQPIQVFFADQPKAE
jgi:hypothetical protein